MKLDLSCPIELRGYALSYTDTQACAELRLYNLSRRRISAFEGVAKWRSSAAGRSIVCPFCAERLRAGGENGFRISLNTDRMPDADSLDVLFTRVSYDDGSDDWRSGEGLIVDVGPLPAIDPASLSALRAAAGPDAVCLPVQDDLTWRCVCGRTNPADRPDCARCGRSADDVLRKAPDAEPPCGEEAPLSREELADLHDRFIRQRSRLLRRTVAAAVALLALAVFCVVHFQDSAELTSLPAETQTLNVNK